MIIINAKRYTCQSSSPSIQLLHWISHSFSAGSFPGKLYPPSREIAHNKTTPVTHSRLTTTIAGTLASHRWQNRMTDLHHVWNSLSSDTPASTDFGCCVTLSWNWHWRNQFLLGADCVWLRQTPLNSIALSWHSEDPKGYCSPAWR